MSNGGVVVVISGKDDTEKVFQAIEGNLKRTTTAAHETESALAQLGERAQKYLEYAGIALAVRGTINAFKELVTSSLDLGEALSKASEKTGLSVGTLSTLHYAAGITNSDFDSMASAVGKLGADIGAAVEGNKQLSAAFSGMGLNVKELVADSDGAEKAFRQITQEMANTENSSVRLRLATELLGKAGKDQIPLLVSIGENWDYYKQKASEAGVQLDGKTAEALEDTNRKLHDLQQTIVGAEVALTTGLLPALNEVFGTLENGQTDFSALKEFGEDIGRVWNFAAAAVDGFAAGMAKLQEIEAYATFHFKEGKLMSQVADDDDADAKRHMDEAINGIPHIRTSPKKPHGSGKGLHLTGDLGEADKIASAKQARDAAQTRLDEQMAQLRAQIAKGSEEQQLADLEDSHKRALISDQDFYARKLAIEKASFDAQRQAAQEKQADIDKQIASLTSDEKKQGANSAKGIEDQTKILDLRTRRLQIDGEIAKINADGAKAELDYQQQIYDLTIKQMEQTDELAAKREEITGGSVEQRLHQSADNYIVKRDELVANYGEGSKQVSDADFEFGNEQSKIRAAGAEQNSNPVIAGINAQRTAVSDAEARGTTTTVAAQQQRIELDREEAQALGPVLAAYEELANAGDLEATQKVIELKSRIAELNDPVDEVSQHMREQFDSAFESLFENLDQGTKAFQSFFRDIEKELERETYKRYLEPLVQQGLGKVFPNKIPGLPGNGDAGFGGGAHDDLPDAGEASGIGGATIKALKDAAGFSGAGADAKKGGVITIQLINNGDTPLNVGDTSASGGLDKDQVLTIITNDFSSGGIMRALFGGGGGSGSGGGGGGGSYDSGD